MVWCDLIYIVIQPVCIDIVGMSSPGEQRLVVRIVIRIIVVRDMDRKTLGLIASEFLIESQSVIFRVTHHIDLPSLIGHNEKSSCFVGFGKDRQSAVGSDLVDGNIGMSGVRHQKYIVKASD